LTIEARSYEWASTIGFDLSNRIALKFSCNFISVDEFIKSLEAPDGQVKMLITPAKNQRDKKPIQRSR